MPSAVHAVMEILRKLERRETPRLLHKLCLIDRTMPSVTRSSGPHALLFLSINIIGFFIAHYIKILYVIIILDNGNINRIKKSIIRSTCRICVWNSLEYDIHQPHKSDWYANNHNIEH